MTFAARTPGRILVLCAVALPAVGCGGGSYPVTGTVTLDDGSPLTKGLVVFESSDGTSMARGQVQSDGNYQLSTSRPGDGVKPGRYRVLVSPLDLSDVPDEKKNLPFDVKYTRFQTSGIEVEVKAEANVIPIQLTRPAGPKQRPR
jgi:hypothetical protein